MTISVQPEQAEILWIGDREHPEFAELAESIASRDGAAFFQKPDDALDWLTKTKAFLSAIVLAPSSPGEFAQTEIDAIRQLAPLAQVFEVVGGLQQDELRTGKPLAGTTRIGWVQAKDLWSYHAGKRRYNRGSLFSQPATATPEERLENRVRNLPRLTGRAAVSSRDPRAQRLLIDALARFGVTAAQLGSETPTESLDLVVWDFITEDAEEFAEARAAIEKHTPARVLLIKGFFRGDGHCELPVNTRIKILPKPWTLDELAAAIEAAFQAD